LKKEKRKTAKKSGVGGSFRKKTLKKSELSIYVIYLNLTRVFLNGI
jgi:hypothetical protein